MTTSAKATSADTWRIVATIGAELSEDVHTLQTGYLNRHTGRMPVVGIDRGGRRRVWLWIGDIAYARELNAAALRDLGVEVGRWDRILAQAKELHACNPYGAWPIRKDDSVPVVLGPTGIEGPSGFVWPVGFRAVFETLQRTMPECEAIRFSSTTIPGKGGSSQVRSYVHVTDVVGTERLAVLLPNFNGILRAYIAAGSAAMEKEDRLTADAWARSFGTDCEGIIDAGIALHTIVSFSDVNEVWLV